MFSSITYTTLMQPSTCLGFKQKYNKTFTCSILWWIYTQDFKIPLQWSSNSVRIIMVILEGLAAYVCTAKSSALCTFVLNTDEAGTGATDNLVCSIE